MSLAIEVDRVRRVLLSDGWHLVGGKTFDLDSYEYLNGSKVLLRGGSVEQIPSTGFCFREGILPESPWLYGPLTAILAVEVTPSFRSRIMNLFATLIDTYGQTARQVADRRNLLRRAELDLDRRRVQLAEGLIGQENALTNRPHSWTSATAAAAQMPEVLDAEAELLDERYALELKEIELKPPASWTP